MHFEFIKLVTQMKIPLKKRENELLQDTLGLRAAELKDGSQEVNDCTKHVQMPIGMPSFYSSINHPDNGNFSFFSFPWSVSYSSGVTQIWAWNWKFWDFHLYKQTSGQKTKIPPWNIPDIDFCMVPYQVEFSSLNASLCQICAFLSLETIRAKSGH